MREIVQLSVGKFGNNVGYEFWRNVAKEHSIDPTGSGGE